MKPKKRIVIILSVMMTFAVWGGISSPAHSATADVSDLTTLRACLNSGTEVTLYQDITATTQIDVNEDSSIDLNGFKLTVSTSPGGESGIRIATGKTLIIKDSKYTNENNPGDGKLTTSSYSHAGICTTDATLIIQSGVIKATGGSGAGIGGSGGSYAQYYEGGTGGNGGTITINGGTIDASSGNSAAIGGGCGGMGGSVSQKGGSGGDGGTITINGGLVRTTVYSGNAGNIGGGAGGYGGSQTGSGSGTSAAGGPGGNGGIITINNGIVDTVGGIGGGTGGRGGTSGTTSGGIGGAGGDGGTGGTITINNGTVSAAAINNAGIGGGGAGPGGYASGNGTAGLVGTNGGAAGAITINGGSVKAKGADNAFDVGGGFGRVNMGLCSSLTVTGGILELTTNGRGTNASIPSFKNCTVKGDGAVQNEGTYDANGKIKVTVVDLTADSESGTVVPGENVELLANMVVSRTTNLSTPKPAGDIVFKDNGTEIGRGAMVLEGGVTAEGYITASANIIWTPSTVGTHNLTAEYVAGTNDKYAANGNAGTLSFEVKYKPTVVWPSGLTAIYGKTLADIPLDSLVNSGGVAGAFSWKTPGTLVGSVGEQSHRMVFTPDNTLYGKVTKEIIVMVGKADLTSDHFDANLTSVTYNGGPKPINVTEKMGVTGVGVITVYYEGTGTTYYEKSATAPSEPGRYIVTIDVAEGENYHASTGLAIGAYEINKVGREVPNLTHLFYNLTDKTYDGTPKPVVVTAQPIVAGLGKITVFYMNAGYPKSTTAPTDAGTYAVVVNIADGYNYLAESDLLLGTITINKATVTVKADNKNAYKGGNKPEYTYTVTGLSGGDELGGTVSFTDDANMNVAGNYTIIPTGGTVPGSGNYNNTIIYETGVLKVTPLEYTVTFKDGDYVIDEQIIERGQAATAPGIPIKTGYTFDGWDKSYNYITGDLTVNAQWKINVYTVVFKNGDTVIKTEEVEHNQGATAPTPTKTGYTFIGWDKLFNKVTGNLTVNAQWDIATYTVTFRDGDSVIKSQIVEHGQGATAPANPSRAGYTFDGWNTSFDCVTGDLTVSAKWKINLYTVTFKNESTIIKTEEVEYNQAATAPPTPIRIGYTFIGWDKQFSKVTGNLTVNAQWTTSIYTVTFKDDNAVLGVQLVEYGETATAPFVPTKSGYIFTGWDSSLVNVISNMTVNATWAKITANIIPATKTVKKGKTLKLTATSNATIKQVTWSVSNKKVASIKVSGTGKIVCKVKGIKKGKKATITAKITFQDGSIQKVSRIISVK